MRLIVVEDYICLWQRVGVRRVEGGEARDKRAGRLAGSPDNQLSPCRAKGRPVSLCELVKHCPGHTGPVCG